MREHRPFPLKRVFFVDNVITSGNTLEACAQALGFGTGLVYADNSTPPTPTHPLTHAPTHSHTHTPPHIPTHPPAPALWPAVWRLTAA